jgi:hypothetical protein
LLLAWPDFICPSAAYDSRDRRTSDSFATHQTEKVVGAIDDQKS